MKIASPFGLLVAFVKWGSSSLIGHIAVMQLFFSAPIYLTFLVRLRDEGTLTVSWAMYMIAICVLIGAVVGALGWFTVTSPLIKQRQRSAK